MDKILEPTVLTEIESRRFLQKYHINLNKAAFTTSKSETLKAAEKMSFPLVLKVASKEIVHKSDVGGVVTNIETTEEISQAYDSVYTNAAAKGIHEDKIDGVVLQEMINGQEEMLVGIKRDPLFGPVLVIGLGGVFVELMRDVSLGICPLTKVEILSMIKSLKGYPLLNGYRGRPKLDVDALVLLCEEIMHMALDDERISELDLNPVMIKEQGKGAIAVDARIVLTENDE